MKFKSAFLPFTVLAAVLSAGNVHAALLVPPGGTDTILGSGDDFSDGPRAIGFSFQFYGTTATDVYVNSNGSLTFGGGDGTFGNPGFPTGGLPRVSPFWDDLGIPGGGLRENTTVAGQYTAIWNNVGFVLSSGLSATAEAILLGPGNAFGLPANSILFSYDAISGDPSPTVGLNDGDGFDFESLFPLGIGAADGTLDGATSVGLSGRSFLFTPVYGQPPALTDGGGLNQVAQFVVDYNVSEYQGQSEIPEGVPSAWALGLLAVAYGGFRYLRSRKA